MVSKIKKILYATDLSKNSRPALEWAFLLAQRHNAKVVLFHSAEGISSYRNSVIKSHLGEQR
jgi:nucleotide-binding universal stress UspA family protein